MNQNRAITIVIGLGAWVLGVSAARADFQAELVDEGIYFVEYARGRMTAGGLLDTEKNADRKVESGAHALCLAAGYAFLKFPTLGEISRDENLKSVWELATGGEGMRSKQTSGNMWSGSVQVHQSRRLVLLADEEAEGYKRCLAAKPEVDKIRKRLGIEPHPPKKADSGSSGTEPVDAATPQSTEAASGGGSR